jgi:hypothetical protein
VKRALLAATLAATACSTQDPSSALPPPPPTTAPTPASPDCATSFAATGVATWVVIKNATLPVTGHQAITGTLEGPTAELAGNTVRLRLAFDPIPTTGIEIRDNRISQYIFGPTALGFEATFVRSATGTKDGRMPVTGETAALVLAGVFYVAAGRVPLDIPVYLTALKPGEYEVRSQPGGIALDLRTQLNVSKSLDDMLALVNATVDPKVTVQFSLTLKKGACP